MGTTRSRGDKGRFRRFGERTFVPVFRCGGNMRTYPRSGFRSGGTSAKTTLSRMTPVRFGCGLGVERFERFRFSVPSVLHKKGFSVFQYIFIGKDGSGFGSWKTVPAVPVPLSVSGKTVPTVPVSGSGSVPEPPCLSENHPLKKKLCTREPQTRECHWNPEYGLQRVLLSWVSFLRSIGLTVL